MVTQQDQPVEFFLTPGSVGDTRTLKHYHFVLPEGARVVGDKAYTPLWVATWVNYVSAQAVICLRLFAWLAEAGLQEDWFRRTRYIY